MVPTERVAERYLVRLAARRALSAKGFHSRSAALRDFTPRVASAFIEAFWLPSNPGQIHKEAVFRGLVKKVKKLWGAFKKLPQLWTKFKKLIGIDKLTDIPKALKELAKKGFKLLRGLVRKAFSKWPLKLYTLEEGKILSFNTLLEKIAARFPRAQAWFTNKARPFMNKVDALLRKYLPGVGHLAIVAIFIWIWFNVTEFEWDLKALTDAITGALTLGDLIGSLPGSAIGFLMNGFGFGTFTLLPILIGARILLLLSLKLARWKGGRFELDEEGLAGAIGVDPEEMPA